MRSFVNENNFTQHKKKMLRSINTVIDKFVFFALKLKTEIYSIVLLS